MKEHLKKYFIPHEGNDYHPHILHTKRTFFYGGLFLTMKVIVVIFAAMLPLSVFSLPTVTQEQYRQVIELTNNVRKINGKQILDENSALNQSSLLKSKDMGEQQYFAHIGPDQKDLRSYLREVGYGFRVAGENLSMGFATPEDVVIAWMNSPTHFANLVDSEYKDIGVGVSAGMYNNIPTSYVTQHFGQPKVTYKEEPSINTVANSPKTMDLTVKGVKTENIEYIKDDSKIYWTESEGTTEITVQAHISGTIDKAEVYIDDSIITLISSHDPGMYTGFLTVKKPADSLFKVIMEPSIIVRGVNGMEIKDTIPWHTVKIQEPSVFDKYEVAQSTLGGITKIFDAQKIIYIAFFTFFAIALIISIVVEIKRQHHHVIFQTLLLLGLLVWMISY